SHHVAAEIRATVWGHRHSLAQSRGHPARNHRSRRASQSKSTDHCARFKDVSPHRLFLGVLLLDRTIHGVLSIRELILDREYIAAHLTSKRRFRLHRTDEVV